MSSSATGPVAPRQPELAVDANRRRRMPPSVRYARGLLYLQASIWILLCGGGIAIAVSPVSWLRLAVTLGFAGVCGAMGAAKARLGRRITRGSDATRRAVVAIEWFMGGLGAVTTLIALRAGTGLFPLWCLGGGGLSVTAAIRLGKPPARLYFGSSGSEIVEADPASPPDAGGSIPFWRLTQGITGA